MIYKNRKGEFEKGLFPNVFVSEKEKRSDDYIAMTADYFASMAMQGYRNNLNTFIKNYAFVKGELNPEDFYEDSEVNDFITDLIDEDNPLPKYIQAYSILAQPLNTMKGELAGRPDDTMVKAFDDDSRSEALSFKTDLLQQYILSSAQNKISMKLAEQGIDMETEEGQAQLQQLTEEEVGDQLTSYTTTGEKWGSRMLEALKMEFNLKEVCEDAFTDLLVTARPRFHIHENNSKIGFGVECVNPKNVVLHKSPNKKYSRDAYASSIIDVLTISEILDRFNLTKEEVDHLREDSEYQYRNKAEMSNLFSGKTGLNSITYNTYYEGERQDRMANESMLLSGESLDDMSSKVLGDYFVVVQTYVLMKTKIGKLTYMDEEGQVQTTMVGEDYKNGEHPSQIELEWGYQNQWWQYLKIGNDVYQAKPFELLEYNPIIGVDFENRNMAPKSLVDLMKPWQMIFNLCMNQLWELLQKEQGVMVEFNWRKIPKNEDSSYQDALDEWLTQARELGFIFNDDSPENMKAPMNNTNTTKVLDLGRAGEMQSRLNIAMQVKAECHALVGITQERLGAGSSSQTATGIQTSLSASYSQTEPWFTAQEYINNQFFQGILDAAQYIEGRKETSTIGYITNEGEHAFVEMSGADLKLRDLRIYVTSRSDDARIFQQLQGLAQPMLQNGADFSTVAQMFDTKSLRVLHDTFKADKANREKQRQQEMQMRQQEMESQNQQMQAQIQAQGQQAEIDRSFKAQQNELDRQSKIQIAAITASGRDQMTLNDTDSNGQADVLALTKMDNEINAANRKYELEQTKIQSDISAQQSKITQDKARQLKEDAFKQEELKIKKDEQRLKEKKIDTDFKIAKENKNKFD